MAESNSILAKFRRLGFKKFDESRTALEKMTAITKSFMRFSTMVFHHNEFMSLLNFVFKLCHENVSGVREMILSDATKKIARHMKVTAASTVSGITMYACYPLYDFVFNGKYTLISPLLMPFVDENYLGGFLTLSAVNVVAAFYAIRGTFAFNGLFLLFVDVYDGMVSLIEDDFELFDSMWEQQKNQFTNENRKRTFRNIMTELMDLISFSAYINKLIGHFATIQMGGCFCEIVTVLFGYLADDYVGGLGVAVYFVIELMVFCFIGQLLENTWYNYEVMYQKDIMFALNIFQNTKPILIANIYPLNFETGLHIIKNIYSVLLPLHQHS